MKLQIASALLSFVAVASAGLIGVPSAEIIAGPSSRSTVIGPEGSIISSATPGGQVITQSSPGLIAGTEPLLAAQPIVSSNIITGVTPLTASAGLIGASPLIARSGIISPATLGLSGLGRTVVSGPSGIVTSDAVLAPTWPAAPLIRTW